MSLPNCSLRFADSFANDRYKLFEVSSQIANDFLQGKKQLSIVGRGDDKGVIVSQNETFDIVNCETTNTLFIMRNSVIESEGNLQCMIETSVGGHYETTERPPRLHVLRDMLSITPLTNEEIHDGVNAVVDGERFTLCDLREIIQASAKQLDEALININAFEFNGFWRIMSTDLVDCLVAEILDIIEEQGFEFHSVSLFDCCSLLGSDRPQIVVLQILKMLSNSQTRFQERDEGKFDEIFSLNHEKVCQRTAILVLRHHKKVSHDKFMAKWRQRAPALMNVDKRMLRGIAIDDKESMLRYWTYLPIEALSSNPKTRFTELFKIQRKWTREEMLPFLGDLENGGYSIDKLLLQHTRAIKQKVGNSQTISYTSRQHLVGRQ